VRDNFMVQYCVPGGERGTGPEKILEEIMAKN